MRRSLLVVLLPLLFLVFSLLVPSINATVTVTDPAIADAIAQHRAIHLTDANWEQHIGMEGSAWFVDFYAPWCGYCKNLAPHLDTLAHTIHSSHSTDPVISNLYIAKLDCIDNPQVAEQQWISSYPTLKLFQKGQEPKIYRGSRSVEGMMEFLRTAMTSHTTTAPSPSLINDATQETRPATGTVEPEPQVVIVATPTQATPAPTAATTSTSSPHVTTTPSPATDEKNPNHPKSLLLHAFTYRGDAEVLRLVLEHVHAPYRELRIPTSSWFKERSDGIASGLYPFGVAPALEVDALEKFNISTTSAILRYIGRAYDLYGTDDVTRAKIDVVIAGCESVRSAYFALVESTSFATIRHRYFSNTLSPWLQLVHDILHMNAATRHSSSLYIANSILSIADFILYDTLLFQLELDSKCLTAYPRIKTYVDFMSSFSDGIRAYQSSPRRPKWAHSENSFHGNANYPSTPLTLLGVV